MPVRKIHRRHLISRRAAALLLGCCLFDPAKVLASAADPLTREIVARSQLSAGKPGRLAKVFAKARRGEPITLGVIGGSITVGAFASHPDRSYAGRLLAWWREQFPKCEIRLINAGVGGTGSMYGALRAGRDLLSGMPDLVVVEFAVNDNWTDGEAYEGLIRQILAQPNQPAIMLLFMMWERGGNDQEMQARVGAHYGLPMVSFRDALWPEIAAGRLKWSDYIVDIVHPNDAGHAAAARFLTTMCAAGLNAAAANAPDVVDPLPAPLHSDAFQFVHWRDAAGLEPAGNQGWTRSVDDKNRPAWTAAERGGKIAFDWSGSGLVAVFKRAPDAIGEIRAGIDGVSFQTLDASTQPRREIVILAQGLRPGRHTVELAAVDPSGKSSAGGVELVGLGSIGVAQD
jgi:hypothetical protein